MQKRVKWHIKYTKILAKYEKILYLCNVFFMVLDY